MRSRMSALLLSVLLVAAVAACNKKEQSQNQPPAATTSEALRRRATSRRITWARLSSLLRRRNSSSRWRSSRSSKWLRMRRRKVRPLRRRKLRQLRLQPPPPPLVIPAGTGVVIRMGNTIDTKTANPGDSFTGTLAHAIAVKGVVVVPAGAGVAGTVVDAKSPGRFKGEGNLSITLTSINVKGVPTTIRTSTYTQTIKGKGKRTAGMVGGGTGAGALIGGLAGGGKGALIGGLVGAGAGTAGAAFTGNKDLQVPAESVVTFKLSHSLTVKQSASQ